MDRAAAQAILDISPDATPDEVRAAYRRRAFATHPDRAGGDAAAFHAVYDAYQFLSAPPRDPGPEPGSASEPGTTSQVPPADAAKVLFEYLSDLASEMILNGATPEMVVAFLAREGCPESVARALERDLRAKHGAAEPPAPPAVEAPRAAAPSVAPHGTRPPVSSFRRWPVVALGTAALAACIAGAWLVAGSPRSPAIPAEVPAPATGAPAAVARPAPAAPAAIAVAPAPQRSEPSRPSGPAPAAPPRTAPARPSAPHAPRPAERHRDLASVGGASAEIDAERDALEADQRRFAAVLADLEAERRRIDLTEAELANTSDVERFSALANRKAAYNARIAVARQTEKDLQRRVRELNARIAAWNDRVRAAR